MLNQCVYGHWVFDSPPFRVGEIADGEAAGFEYQSVRKYDGSIPYLSAFGWVAIGRAAELEPR